MRSFLAAIVAVVSFILGVPTVREYRRHPYLWWGVVGSFWGAVVAAVAIAALGYNNLAAYAFVLVLAGGMIAFWSFTSSRP